MIVIGIFLLMCAAMAAINIITLITPIICCYRQGIECRLVGNSSLDSVPLVPRWVRIAWKLVSLQGFQSRTFRILWQEFRDAKVVGTPMAYVLRVEG